MGLQLWQKLSRPNKLAEMDIEVWTNTATSHDSYLFNKGAGDKIYI